MSLESKKMCVPERSADLTVFEFAALLAAGPAWTEMTSIYESGKASAMCFPLSGPPIERHTVRSCTY